MYMQVSTAAPFCSSLPQTRIQLRWCFPLRQHFIPLLTLWLFHHLMPVSLEASEPFHITVPAFFGGKCCGEVSPFSLACGLIVVLFLLGFIWGLQFFFPSVRGLFLTSYPILLLLFLPFSLPLFYIFPVFLHLIFSLPLAIIFLYNSF